MFLLVVQPFFVYNKTVIRHESSGIMRRGARPRKGGRAFDRPGVAPLVDAPRLLREVAEALGGIAGPFDTNDDGDSTATVETISSPPPPGAPKTEASAPGAHDLIASLERAAGAVEVCPGVV